MSQRDLSEDRICPVCGHAAIVTRQWLGEDIHRVLARTLDAVQPLQTPLANYALACCQACSLEFAIPLQEPGADFYAWLTANGFAYPADRWEWQMAQLVAQQPQIPTLSGAQHLSILDVGCGSGAFIEQINQTPFLTAIGIDHNAEVVAACQARGLQVHRLTLEEVAVRYPDGFSIVTLWHVVEHVADPVGVLHRALSLVGKEGLVLFSVPVSPLSYESLWPDPFNLPPHHLTRWNSQSIAALGRRLQCTVRVQMPAAKGLLHRMIRALTLAECAGRRRSTLARCCDFLVALVRSPKRLVAEYRRQRLRVSADGQPLADVMLVQLSRRRF